jgi:hypothetical protein
LQSRYEGLLPYTVPHVLSATVDVPLMIRTGCFERFVGLPSNFAP